MARRSTRVFSEGGIGGLTLPNRLVRSATWDPSVVVSRRVTDEVVDLYRELAEGGAGLIITGDFPVVPGDFYTGESPGIRAFSYDEIRIDGINRLADVVHRVRPGGAIVAQLSRGYSGPGPSEVTSPFLEESVRPLSREEIGRLIICFAEAIEAMRGEGFDGVQLHAAHGSLLSGFLSPHTNRRSDEFGGSIPNRARIVREILATARDRVGDYPILIKMNCTDYIGGGIDLDTFPALAAEIASAGVCAIEISGGMWDCLIRSEADLGFRPVPAPESHTRIHASESQSYFLEYAEQLDLDIPVILTGGNRDVERLERIIRGGRVDFIGMSRPLISEPDLPNRWLAGRGRSTTDCISCNSCLYDMYVHPGRTTPGLVTCVYKGDREMHRTAQAWLAAWVAENRVS